jgi:hypothetical protein
MRHGSTDDVDDPSLQIILFVFMFLLEAKDPSIDEKFYQLLGYWIKVFLEVVRSNFTLGMDKQRVEKPM